MSELNINIDMEDLVRDFSFRGDEKTVGIQLGKMISEEHSFQTILAIAIVKFHELEGNYTKEEAKIRIELALDEPQEVLNGVL